MTTEASPYLTLPIRSEEEARGGTCTVPQLDRVPDFKVGETFTMMAPKTDWLNRLRRRAGLAFDLEEKTFCVTATTAPPHTEGGREGT